MRLLMHPDVKDITVEGILYAFSDPVRVQIYMDIAGASCPQTCSTFLSVRGKSLPKSTLSQHFKILREAGLIRSVRQGVEMRNTTRCEELRARFGPMIKGILEAYKAQHQETKRGRK